MDINDEVASFHVEQARIMVVGAGGGGCNTVNRLTEMGIAGANTIAANTDAKHLAVTKAGKRILLGRELTRGMGAGGFPEVGKKAAEESKNDIREALQGCDLLFLTCGLGGGTGTGAAPVVAYLAKEMGAIVIAAVTLPFKIEGARIIKAEEGLAKLREVCDTVIVIENQKLVELAGNRPLKEAFGVSDGLIATIGVGESDSQYRAKEAVQKALNHPLLDVDYSGATGAMIQIIGGEDMKLEEINTIGEAVSQHMDPEALVMWGARVVPEFSGKIQVITIITGVKSPYILGKTVPHYAVPKSKKDDIGIEIIV